MVVVAIVIDMVIYRNTADIWCIKFLFQNYLFDPKVLTDDMELPNDRCCRACGKIGHIQKDCPVVQARKKRQEKENKDQDKQKKTDHTGNVENLCSTLTESYFFYDLLKIAPIELVDFIICRWSDEKNQ